ncbi:SDR family oxidoreductase [Luteimonas fraxinea]|uniref:SDR family oxidoreductase n=1 Tax=Luteimonas fraxinea TaxID=2901869 RepID=A0ABS8U901_9GAMM|nr:SDR family oxidoreductase [Luteimonas fraxinea]MCD9095390.1 SDR family oxidoreductase [Luteimonas fraxinea]MCD9126371.1 SDR family oxidoreductase [Luteimonas fraxinea]UHH11400.1 SDR family oxidoreductase [Luteimonas fraxinea]
MPQTSLPSHDRAAPWQEVVTPGRFTGLKVVVTGAGSGIGLATALRIVREGGRVVASDLDAGRLDALRAAQPEVIVPVAGDITDDAHLAAIIAACDGSLDGLVNNAGIIDGFTALGDTSDTLWARVMDVNLNAPFKLTREALPMLQRSGAASVVNVASEAGLRGSTCGTAYTTSKHALIGMSKSAAFFYPGVRVNVVAPGAVATNIVGTVASEWAYARAQAVNTAIGPPQAQSDQVAASITFLLSRDATNLTGAVLPSDGGWSVR